MSEKKPRKKRVVVEGEEGEEDAEMGSQDMGGEEYSQEEDSPSPK